MIGSRTAGSLFRALVTASVVLFLGGPSVRADLLLHYDFNDDSDPSIVIDSSGNDNEAEVLGAEYTADGGGRSGEDGDLAMDLRDPGDGAHISVLTAMDGAFETITENDAVTIALWVRGGDLQPVNDTIFRFEDDGGTRILSSHIPWGNGTVYFDVGGCCAGATPANRIQAGTAQENYRGRWNHYAFVKDGVRTAIYQNGELFLESGANAEMVSLEPFVISIAVFGSSIAGNESYHGLVDDIYVYDEPLSPEEIAELAVSGREELLVSPTTVRMRVGEERQLQVTHFAPDGTQTDRTTAATGTTYSTDPAGVVSISADGLVRGVDVGDTVVTATNGNVEANAMFTVVEAPAPAELLLYYDFNDDSDPSIVTDASGNDNDADVLGAEYTADGGGRTGEDGDLAMDFRDPGDNAHISVITAMDGAFESISENDAVTISMWVRGGDLQPVNQTNFRFEDDGGTRILSSHIPWGNGVVYFDVGGCCAQATPANRIQAATSETFYKDEWNHYAFVKDGPWTAIYQNAELFLEAAPTVEMVSIEGLFITNAVFGSSIGGGESYHGLIDEIGVWDGALTQDEILRVMDEGALPSEPPEPSFVRADANADAVRNIADAVFVLNYLFGGEETVEPPCLDAADGNDDGRINIADGVFVLTFLFASGPDPAPPFPDCGPDPTADPLSCDEFSPCGA